MVEPEPESMKVDEPAPQEIIYSQSLFVSQNPNQESLPDPEPETRTSQKRRVSQVSEDEEPEIAPVAAALKRRRLADEADRRRRGVSTPPPTAAPPPQVATPSPVAKEEPTNTKGRGKKIKKEEKVDIIEVARHRREQADAEAKAERESYQQQDSQLDVKKVQSLTLFDAMPLRTKPAPVRTARADESEHWEDKWNTMKNFKKFRRRPGADHSTRGFEKVIVPLEVAKTRDFGLGDGLWETESQRKKKTKGKSRDTQDTSQAAELQRRSRNAVSQAARRVLASEPEEDSDAPVVLNDEVVAASEEEEDFVAPLAASKVGAGRASSQQQQHQKLADKTSTSKNLPAAVGVGKGQKRPAAAVDPLSTKAAPPPAKRTKVTASSSSRSGRRPTAEESDEESSDDGLKFRFKKT